MNNVLFILKEPTICYLGPNIYKKYIPVYLQKKSSELVNEDQVLNKSKI